MEIVRSPQFQLPHSDQMIEVFGVPTEFLPLLPKGQSATEPYLLFFDVGGTKIFAQVLDAQGRVVERIHETAKLKQGPEGLIAQIQSIGLPLLKTYHIDHVDISSAGPLDPSKGLWVNPTNLKTDGQPWGIFDVLTPLREAFGIANITLENDAAAQALLMHKYHSKAQGQDFLLLTLGTGVGVAIIKDGALLRTSEGLHPELSHIPLYETDEAGNLIGLEPGLEKARELFGYPLLCGCGKYGCLETFLAGTYFAKGQPTSDLQVRWMKEFFLPRTIRMFCHEYGLEKVFVSGSFGQFLLSR